MDLEKVYDRVDRDPLWQVLRLYGVGVDSRACVRIGNEVSEWLSVNVGVRQGCVMSPRLFNLYMDGVVREVQARTLGRRAQLVGTDEEKLEVSQLSFADDTVLMGNSNKKLERLVAEFGSVCRR